MGEGMYRFSIDGREWILRFSQHLEIEEKEKDDYQDQFSVRIIIVYTNYHLI